MHYVKNKEQKNEVARKVNIEELFNVCFLQSDPTDITRKNCKSFSNLSSTWNDSENCEFSY